MNTGLILMFVALAVCLLIGVPVAFSIGISCMTLLYVNGGPSMDILLQRMVSGAKSFNMLAMPMFIFAGALMVYGSTPRLIKLANMLLRKFPGGLGATAMAACGFFGAVSGSGVASAAAIGKIIGPSMLEEGYPKGLTSGLIASSRFVIMSLIGLNRNLRMITYQINRLTMVKTRFKSNLNIYKIRLSLL